MTVTHLSKPARSDQFSIRAKFDDQTLSNCTIGRLPPWDAPYAEDLMRSLLSPQEPFLYTFAVAAAKNNSPRFRFIENLHNNDIWHPLLDIFSDYLKVYQKIPRDTSIVILFSQGERISNMTECYRKFWEILQFLHDNDPGECPVSVPCQVDDEWWEFSFGGVPIFAVCSTPVHNLRKSRSGPTFLITFQPRWVFEGLEADTPRGTTAQRVIRERLRVYDDVEPSPELGAYGNTGNREWKQYFLSDENQSSFPRCPFRHRRNPVAATEQGSSVQ